MPAGITIDTGAFLALVTYEEPGYIVAEVIDPEWQKQPDGSWQFEYKTHSTHPDLLSAQEEHARITRAENFPMLPGGYHKYVIITLPA